MNRIVLIETIFPDYRMGLFVRLKETHGEQLLLVCGKDSFSATLQTASTAGRITKIIRNSFLLGRRLLWQAGLNKIGRDVDLVIIEFNLRAPSTWWLLWRRHRAGRPTVFWGHASGSRSISAPIRRWMLRRAAGFIAYMPAEQRRLQAEFLRLPVWVAPNAMMWARDCRFLTRPATEVVDVIYVGRIVAKKKVGLLLTGFAEATNKGLLPARSRLLLIGDGPERAALHARALALGLGERVVFPGRVADVAQLREWYAGALVAVSPGYVGLSVTQALSFGVPMLIADHEPHSPEIELCEAGRNAVFFRSDDPADLARALGEFTSDCATWVARREEISRDVREHYSFDAMAATFEQVIATYVTNLPKTHS